MLLRCAAALLLGGLATLGFAPYHWPALTLVGFFGLLELWRAATPGRAALYGFCFGAAHFASGIYWVFISTYRYGGAPAWLSVWLVIVLSWYMALYPTLVGWCTTRWRASGAACWALLQVPAAWAFGELVRGTLGTGFPWLSLGYAWVDTPLAKTAPFAGVHGMSWLAVLAAAALWLLWRGLKRERWIAIIALGVTALSALLLPSPLRWTEPIAEPLAVGIVQGNIPQQLKWDRGARAQIKQRYLELSETLEGAQLIVWPEVAIPASYDEEQLFLEQTAQWAQARNQTLLAGVLWRSGATLYNTVLALGAGQGDGVFYLKRHLVPFGEFFPIPDFLRLIMQGLDLD
ncbi:MAG: apolipoprotein N-acyltransferase, partial [Lysobacterales bacterium]